MSKKKIYHLYENYERNEKIKLFIDIEEVLADSNYKNSIK